MTHLTSILNCCHDIESQSYKPCQSAEIHHYESLFEWFLLCWLNSFPVCSVAMFSFPYPHLLIHDAFQHTLVSTISLGLSERWYVPLY